MSAEGTSVDVLLKEIKSQGYWQVIIRPLRFEKERIKSLSDCAELVRQCKVSLRGWDYPHISRRYGGNDGIVSGIDWIENLTNWETYKEIWRMYLSGQFIHSFRLREDGWEGVRIFWSEKGVLVPGYGLEIISTLYTVNEIYEFTARLAKKGVFDEGLSLSITLDNMRNRRLVTADINRYIEDNHICHQDQIPLERTVSSSEEILSKGKEYAIDDTCRIFEVFSWLNVPRKFLIDEQEKFLKGTYT